MKIFVIAVLLVATLKADQSHWEVVTATAQRPNHASATWTFAIRNVSGRDLKIAEDWQNKGQASVNLCLSDLRFGILPGLTLIAEPCHHPQSHLAVKPGEIVTAVIPAMSEAPGFERDRQILAILEETGRVMIAPISGIYMGEDPFAPPPGPVPPQVSAEELKPMSADEIVRNFNATKVGEILKLPDQPIPSD